MKKIIYLILSFLFLFSFISEINAIGCTYKSEFGIQGNLEECLNNSDLVEGKISNTDIKINGFAISVKNWTSKVSIALGVAAVFGIVMGGFSLVTSMGEDEKLKKAKDIIKWSIIGFIGVLTASVIVNLLVNFIYSSGSGV